MTYKVGVEIGLGVVLLAGRTFLQLYPNGPTSTR